MKGSQYVNGRLELSKKQARKDKRTNDLSATKARAPKKQGKGKREEDTTETQGQLRRVSDNVGKPPRISKRRGPDRVNLSTRAAASLLRSPSPERMDWKPISPRPRRPETRISPTYDRDEGCLDDADERDDTAVGNAPPQYTTSEEGTSSGSGAAAVAQIITDVEDGEMEYEMDYEGGITTFSDIPISEDTSSLGSSYPSSFGSEFTFNPFSDTDFSNTASSQQLDLGSGQDITPPEITHTRLDVGETGTSGTPHLGMGPPGFVDPSTGESANDQSTALTRFIFYDSHISKICELLSEAARAEKRSTEYNRQDNDKKAMEHGDLLEEKLVEAFKLENELGQHSCRPGLLNQWLSRPGYNEGSRAWLWSSLEVQPENASQPNVNEPLLDFQGLPDDGIHGDDIDSGDHKNNGGGDEQGLGDTGGQKQGDGGESESDGEPDSRQATKDGQAADEGQAAEDDEYESESDDEIDASSFGL